MKIRLVRIVTILTALVFLLQPFHGYFHARATALADNWQQILPSESPPNLAFHALTYDSGREVSVLFGGNDGDGRKNQTWEYDGVDWAQITFPISQTIPSGRENIQQAMVYDDSREKVVLFGGLTVTSYISDTWEYDGSAWIEVQTAVDPPKRDSHTVVYDSDNSRVVLFGGFNPSIPYLNDTWEFDGSTWQQLTPAQSPPGRHHHAAAYDTRRGVVVVFGGIGAGGVLDDTWEFDGTNWHHVYPSFFPPARSNHTMTYDEEFGEVVLFGGVDADSNDLEETWVYDGTDWRPVVPNNSPRARRGAALAYDSLRGKVVMYGGGYFQGTLHALDDTWEYRGSTATYLPIIIAARLDIGMPYDTDRGCPSPYSGCGGPYHGFYKGVSTDLVLDSYLAGASLDIQSEVVQDHHTNPGRYRFGTARYAEDLRRYFNNHQLPVQHSQDFLPGDVAFFDWDDDDLADHAVVVSEIDPQARPVKMVSATGYSSSNASGQARELAWTSYYDLYSMGHARLLNPTSSEPMATTETIRSLRVWTSSSLVTLEMKDKFGKFAGEDYQEDLVASNVNDFIPYIPGSEYMDLGSQKMITVTHPTINTDKYFVEVTAQQNLTYTLYIETLQDQLLTDMEVFTQTAIEGDTQRVNITLQVLSGTISIKSASIQASPDLAYMSPLNLSGQIQTTIEHLFPLTEMGGLIEVDRAVISARDLKNQIGETIAANKITITPDRLDVPAGETREISLLVDLVGAKMGLYQGSLLIESSNCNPMVIPLAVLVDSYRMYLPVLTR